MARALVDRNLGIIFSNTLIAVMGVAVLTPAFPEVSHALGISREEVVLLITVFTLPGIVLAPIMGVLADRLGRKEVLVPSLLLFGGAGGACAFVHTFDTMLILRLLQGVGVSGLATLSITLIGDLFYGGERIRAMGLNASVLSIGTASFPLLGGLLTVLSWRAPFLMFLLAIPVGLVALSLRIPPSPKPDGSISDYAAGVISIMAKRDMLRFVVVGVIVFMVLYGAYLAYFPFLLNELGAPSYIIGAMMATTSASSAIVSFNVDKVARLVSAQRAIQLAFVLATSSMLMMPQIHVLALFLIPTAIYGAAQGIATPVLQNFIVSRAPFQYRAAVMASFSMTIRTGQTIGPVLSAMLAANLGVSWAFYGGAVLTLLGMMLMW